MGNAIGTGKTSMKNAINDENFYIVHGWLKNRLGLKGTKRDIYAIIYGFSQDGESEFTGSLKYFEEWLDISRPTIIKALQELTDSGLIIKRVEVINGVQFNRYKTNLQVVKNFNWGSKEILQGGSKETLPNKDIIINNKNNNDEKKETKKERSHDEIIQASGFDETVKQSLYEFIKMRKLIKKPLTDRALKNLLNRLNDLSGGDNITADKILNQSIDNAWQGIYGLKTERQKQSGSVMDDYNAFNEELNGAFE
jgi:predicted transcriptional regulator